MSSTSEQIAGEQTTGDQSSLREKIKKKIQQYDAGDRFSHIPLQKASILLPLLIKQDKLHLLLTVRSMKLKTMPGDVCFPGGRRESTDKDEIETALRETHEEIGLKPEQVEIIGRLVPYISKTPAYLITPVVAFVEDTFQACPDPDEVTEVFHVPLEFFLSSEHYTPLLLKAPYFGTNVIHSFNYNDPQMQKSFTIWGMTAHFALILSVMLLGKGPAFDTNFKLERRLAECEHALLSFYQSKL
ncbi:peroxisomal coenzyme A diphosphatase NUDT7 [Spea bombifrons]|uniref:peroxisomal coenzyme A diphosphatase NUDT7 n=1 Tax=Spea bombifrons TaxID=233779 RepID=UPI00234A0D22|nr:peroxisomal coenzyme A diphosphatase NUDT7 [Spea bombifrons]